MPATAVGESAVCRAALAATLLLLAACASQPPRYDGELGVGFDSNVANAATERRTRSSALFLAAGAAEQRYQLSPRTLLSARGGLKIESVSRFDALSNLKLSGLLRWQYQPRAEFSAPAYSLWSSLAYTEFDSELRDSGEYRAGAFVDKALSTALSLRLSLSAARRDAGSAVFDWSTQSAGMQLDWQSDRAWLIYGGYQFRAGDVVSTSLPNPTLLRIQDARAPDDAFAPGEIAYRFEADTHVATLGFNRSLSPMLALDAQLQYVSSEADLADVNYSRWLGLVSLLQRF